MVDCKPLISVVIPVYNSERTLSATLKSILDQQSGGSFEIILIDDGSVENCAKLCDELADMYSDCIRCYHQTNQGSLKSRINALKYCRGEYVIYVDADDLIIENSFSLIEDNLVDECDIYLYDYYLQRQDSDNKEYIKTFSFEQDTIFDEKNKKDLFLSFLEDRINTMCGIVIRKEVLDKTSSYLENIERKIIIGEDKLQKMMILLNVEKAKYIHSSFYVYLQNGYSQSVNLRQKQYRESQYEDFKITWDYERKNYKNFYLSDNEIVYFDTKKVSRVIALLQALFDSNTYSVKFKKEQAKKISQDTFFKEIYQNSKIGQQRIYIKIFASLLYNGKISLLYLFAKTVKFVRKVLYK